MKTPSVHVKMFAPVALNGLIACQLHNNWRTKLCVQREVCVCRTFYESVLHQNEQWVKNSA